MEDVIQKTARMRSDIAQKLAGTELECGCGFKRTTTEEEIKKYLAKGWPIHCGLTMSLKTRSKT